MRVMTGEEAAKLGLLGDPRLSEYSFEHDLYGFKGDVELEDSSARDVVLRYLSRVKRVE